MGDSGLRGSARDAMVFTMLSPGANPLSAWPAVNPRGADSAAVALAPTVIAAPELSTPPDCVEATRFVCTMKGWAVDPVTAGAAPTGWEPPAEAGDCTSPIWP